MTDDSFAGLLGEVLEAHGGLARWRTCDRLDATLVSGGLLYDLKGQPTDRSPRRVRVALGRVATEIRPFGAPDQRLVFDAGRTAIEKLDSAVVAESAAVRTSFAGHGLTTPWSALQRAYFSGYALWTYLNSPFLLTLPGVARQPLAPVEHHGEFLAGMEAEFPATIPTHSRRQRFYFDSERLLRRHDYRVEIAGAFPASQYLTDYTVADGFPVPLTRRAYLTDETGATRWDHLMVEMSFSDITFR